MVIVAKCLCKTLDGRHAVIRLSVRMLTDWELVLFPDFTLSENGKLRIHLLELAIVLRGGTSQRFNVYAALLPPLGLLPRTHINLLRILCHLTTNVTLDGHGLDTWRNL